MMGLLEGYSYKELKKMDRGPLITSMRKIYGRPTTQILLAEMAKPKTKSFLVTRDPFKRLLSGYRNKILGMIRGSHHDKISRTILGMISSKMSVITIFGHKHFKQKFHYKFDILIQQPSILVHIWN